MLLQSKEHANPYKLFPAQLGNEYPMDVTRNRVSALRRNTSAFCTGSEGPQSAPFDQSISFKLTKRQKRGPRRDPDSFADQARDYTARVFMPVARSAPRASAPAPDPFYSVFSAWELLCPDLGQVTPDLGGPMVRPTDGPTST